MSNLSDHEEFIVQPRLREWAREYFADLPIRGSARKMNISASRLIDLLRHNDRQIGEEVVRKLAWFARLPEHELFEMAELLPRTPDLTSDTRFLVWVYERLDDQGQTDLVKFAEHLRDRHMQKHPLRPNSGR